MPTLVNSLQGPARLKKSPCSESTFSANVYHARSQLQTMRCRGSESCKMPCIPCHPMSSHAIPCHPMSSHVIPCHPMPSHAIPCHPMSCHAIPCPPMQAQYTLELSIDTRIVRSIGAPYEIHGAACPGRSGNKVASCPRPPALGWTNECMHLLTTHAVRLVNNLHACVAMGNNYCTCAFMRVIKCHRHCLVMSTQKLNDYYIHYANAC